MTITEFILARIAVQEAMSGAALRAVVELHRGQVEDVEWFDAPDETGKAEVCSSCRPAEPTEWNPPRGFAHLRPKGFVASYVLSPCPTLKALASVWADHPHYRPEWTLRDFPELRAE
jgi:hypothetical protein